MKDHRGGEKGKEEGTLDRIRTRSDSVHHHEKEKEILQIPMEKFGN